MADAIVATAFGGPEVLELVEVGVPAPGPGEATVAIRAAAVNPVDHKMFGGLFGSEVSRLPMRVGLEGAGVVTAVGDGASVAVGDEVIVHGGGAAGLYASEVTVPDAALVAKPAALGWEQASGLLLAGGTAEHTLVATGVADGDVVLVHGVAGAVGLAAAQLAILRGARVIGTAAPARHEALRGYGIEPVAYGEGLADRVRAAAPDDLSAAVDTIGTDEAVDVSLALVADRDRIATIAAFGRAADAGITLLGAGPGADPGTALRAAAGPELARLAADGSLQVLVARTFPLAGAADAVRFVQQGHAGGKVVLLP
ncbi:NADP-dependent oxidoreductase [Pseudonocardia sp. KRD291]|uniref:quinone oxidoreductase family protein n=1 Tax=Pseudonocardia sp. KRD291 TaxID=2792007 RepID=UPI001C4A13E6|nr:NADP-dependent oxidoreductase [Pseudonocardia sp. KRD291]MBW0106519.1 NADP-dependent oxidoreductase [Pseudonocardia sp. KRD291]